VRGELAAYDEELASKPEIVALNKIDALDEEERAERAAALKEAAKGAEVLLCSGATGEGVRPLLFKIFSFVAEARREAREAREASEAGGETAESEGVWRP